MLTETDLTSEIAGTASVLLDHLHRQYPRSRTWCNQDSSS